MAPAHKLSHYTLVSDAFLDGTGVSPLRVLFSSRTGARMAVEERIWSALCSDPGADVPAAARTALVEGKFLIPEGEDELAVVLEENKATQDSYSTLDYVIQPTAACQLACDYCGQRHSPNKLSVEKLDEVVSRVEQKVVAGKFRALDIAWFGGEPLLAQDVMRQASARLRELAARRNIEYSARLVTNGLRLDSQAQDDLHELHRIRYVEVTLDGDQATHDARRHWKRTGRGSFETILQNLCTLVNRPPPRPVVGIRCNVDGRNFQGVIPLLQTLAEVGLHHSLARFYVAPVHSWGNSASNLALSPIEFASWDIVWTVEMARLGYRLKLIPRRNYACCIVFKPQAEMVDAFGTRFNCSEVSYVPAYTVAGRNVYDLSNPDDSSPAAKLRTFYDRVAEGAYPCKECQMLPVCAGACPKAWSEGEVPCPPEKFNIGQRLILEHMLRKKKMRSFEVDGEARAL